MIEHGRQNLWEVLRLYVDFFGISVKVGVETIDEIVIHDIEHLLWLSWQWVSEVYEDNKELICGHLAYILFDLICNQLKEFGVLATEPKEYRKFCEFH